MSDIIHAFGPNGELSRGAQAALEGLASKDYVDSKVADIGTSVPGVPIFESLAEAQAYEAANPGTTAYYVTVDDGLTHVVAAAPTFTDEDGTANDTYTIPSSEGVIYKTGATVRTAGTYPGTGTVTVTADPATGYAIDGTRSWSHTFGTGAAPTPITPPAPAADDVTDRITIPDVTGVVYKVDGVDATPPIYAVGNVDATVTVTAHAEAGYSLTGTTSWNFTFTATNADLPTGAVAVFSPSDLPSAGSKVATWPSLDDALTLTATATGPSVVQLAPGVKYLTAKSNNQMTMPISLSGDMTIGLVHRVPDEGSLVHTSGPTFYDMSGATNVRFGWTQVSGVTRYSTRVVGGYTNPEAVVDLQWHRSVLVYNTTSPHIRHFIDGVLSSEYAAASIGAETLLTILNSGAPSMDIAGLVIFDRALNTEEAVALSNYLTTMTGIVTPS